MFYNLVPLESMLTGLKSNCHVKKNYSGFCEMKELWAPFVCRVRNRQSKANECRELGRGQDAGF